ncbi:MAG: DNA-3-methyladenine glycosylase 2 family protein [Clostridiales bacterium]|nr:DNA-3-methyladenine glycosylase 2 family protein [Clostridiales bacterium]
MAITAKEDIIRENGIPFVELSGVSSFNAEMTFECGQCFRFDKSPNGGYEGVAYGRALRVLQPADGHVILYGSTLSDYETVWKGFLSLDEDYEAIQKDICERFGRYGDTIYEAVRCASGIRLLRQEPWEALCSFILSQNNNIPRIKKIITALCRTLGEPFSAMGETYYKFPTARAIADAGLSGLAPCRMGFRARYLLDAAEKCRNGETRLNALKDADIAQAEEALTAICGVGKKVAACTMLYGLHKTEAFPVDVWMRRVLDKYYPDGLDLATLGDYAGIAQQYLFYYEREKASQEREKKRA